MDVIDADEAVINMECENLGSCLLCHGRLVSALVTDVPPLPIVTEPEPERGIIWGRSRASDNVKQIDRL